MRGLLAEMVAGAAAGAAKTALTFPLDVATTVAETSLVATAHAPYAGLAVALAGALPYAAAFHAAFFYAAAAATAAQLPPALREVLAGTCGAVAAAVVGAPLESLKHRVQVLASTARARGARALLESARCGRLYTGLGATLARNVPYNAIHFGAFGASAPVIRRFLGDKKDKNQLVGSTDAANALSGALAGALTALLTSPMDLVTTRLQTQALLGGSPRYATALEALMRISREEGRWALFSGAPARTAQYAVGGLVFFSVYESLKVHLEGR